MLQSIFKTLPLLETFHGCFNIFQTVDHFAFQDIPCFVSDLKSFLAQWGCTAASNIKWFYPVSIVCSAYLVCLHMEHMWNCNSSVTQYKLFLMVGRRLWHVCFPCSPRGRAALAEVCPGELKSSRFQGCVWSELDRSAVVPVPFKDVLQLTLDRGSLRSGCRLVDHQRRAGDVQKVVIWPVGRPWGNTKGFGQILDENRRWVYIISCDKVWT